MTCGVYTITCKQTGKVYVGGSVNIENRWSQHKTMIKHKKHDCPGLACVTDVEYRILLICSEHRVQFYEQLCLDGLKPALNTSSSARGTSPEHWSDERKIKYSENNPMKNWSIAYKNGVKRRGIKRPDLAEKNRKQVGKKPWNYGKTSLITAYSNFIRHVQYWGA